MTEVTNKNSMFFWYPLVKNCGVPQPRTLLVRHEGAFQGRLSYDPLDGKPEKYFDEMIEAAKAAAAEIGYPVFIRSDQTSNKHSWKDSCYVISESQLPSHIGNILEMTAMVDIGFMGVAVREFLDLNWKFKAFYGGMPVAKEFRFFIRDGDVECWHPYWPPTSINRPTIENWREELKKLNAMRETDYAILEAYAHKIGRVLKGYWSVDFCETRNDGWYMTDMAVGLDSYHWGTCPHAPPRNLVHYGSPDFEDNGNVEEEN